MASRISIALLCDISAVPQTRSRTFLLSDTSASRTCTCSYAAARASSSTSSASTSAPSESFYSTSAETPDLETQLLEASLPFLPEHGFTLKSIQEGLKTLQSSPSLSPSLSSFAEGTFSPMFLEQLFPSNIPRRKHSLKGPLKAIQRRDVFKSAETPFPMDDDVEANLRQENEGPRRALFEAWAEEALKQMENKSSSSIKGAKQSSPPFAETKRTVLDLLQERLEYNIPVMQHLPAALSTLARFDPSQPSLSSFRPYLSHVGSIAKHIKAITGSPISTPRLATVYSLSEFYLLSKNSPDIVAVLKYTNDLLKSTEKYDGLIKESLGFAGYALKSWKNIFNSRGL